MQDRGMDSPRREQYVELAFTLDDEDYPAISLSRTLDCRLELLEAMRLDADTTTAFFHVTDGDSDRITDVGRQAEYEENVVIIERFDGESIVEITLTDSIFGVLADAKVPLQSMEVSHGAARLVATVPPIRSPDDVVTAVTQQCPSVSLTSKQTTAVAAPFTPQIAFQTILEERLTDRQVDALALAVEHGYFDRPRRTTQQNLASEMGIAPSTFGQHLHTAIRKLLTTVFTEHQSRSGSNRDHT